MNAAGKPDILIMGRNKDLRRRIARSQGMIEEHENKIRREWMKPHPDEDLIAPWQHEIDARNEQVARLTRRLEREW